MLNMSMMEMSILMAMLHQRVLKWSDLIMVLMRAHTLQSINRESITAGLMAVLLP